MAAAGIHLTTWKFLKLLLITVVIFTVVSVGLHLWFIHNAKDVLEDIITTRSKGKIKIQLSHVSFNLIGNRLTVGEARLVSTDSIQEPTGYDIRFEKLKLHVGSFWSLLARKRMELDSIELQSPDIRVTQWRVDTNSIFAREDLSIPKEMGKMYNSMLDVLEDFGIRRIRINDAALSLHNRIGKGSDPVHISGIFFDLVRSPGSVTRRDEYIMNEHSVDLRTEDQNIVLPGGRHRLAFKKFNLELFRKRIQLDSCTLIAASTNDSKSSYKIFFNKLVLVGVDFNAMYRLNLIRADSVYCENPLFDINLVQSDAVSKKKERPDPEKIIRDLTGDLDLAFVGVKDAGIRINISGQKDRSLFNSNNDDFEMRGLRINSDSLKPVVVDRFDMLVRNYHLYNDDSSAAYTFDSVHFLNNKIILNNFSVVTHSSSQKIRDYKNFQIPYFELSGLDWYELIFEQKLKANAAVMQHPLIHYRAKAPVRSRKRTNLFTALQDAGNLMTLDRISIYNGELHMQFGPQHVFNLYNVDLSVHTNKLLQSRNKEGIRRAVEFLSFSHGNIRLKDLNADLSNVHFTGKNLVHVEKLRLSGKGNSINGVVSDIYIDNLAADDRGDNIIVDGLRWGSADISINQIEKGRAKNSDTRFHLKNIDGRNTKLSYQKQAAQFNTFIHSIRLSSILNNEETFTTNGLAVHGKSLNYQDGPLKFAAAGYAVNSGNDSHLSGVLLSHAREKDSVYFSSDRVNFSADVNHFIQGKHRVESIHAVSPVIRFRKNQVAGAVKSNQFSLGIANMSASDPHIDVRITKNDSTTSVYIPRSGHSRMAISGLDIRGDEISLGKISLDAQSATIVKAGGEVIGVEDGKVSLEVGDVKLGKKDDKPFWSADIQSLHLDNPKTMVFGKNKTTLDVKTASLGNLKLSSEYMTDVDRLIRYNVAAWLKTSTGSFKDSTTTLHWYNASYNYGSRVLSLDSFVYYPTQPRDSVIAHAPFQLDYITFRSGPVEMINFDLENYNKDTSLVADQINITSPQITIYRDKRPPFRSGVIKPLPVDMIRRIRLPVSVQRLKIDDGHLSYTEKNAKTGAEGTLLVSHISGSLSNIRNRNLEQDDSLSLMLTGYLMDSALLDLRVKESYADTAGGFLMTLRMHPTSLAFLNPVVAPLSNVLITSGTIDSLHLRAIGKEDIAFGKMQMFYRDLKIRVVEDGNPDKTSFKGNVMTFLANTFFIKKNNNGRTGLVYFERLRDRSFFNYIIKTAFSGMATSIGVKNNRKYMRQYRRASDGRQLPSLDLQ